MKKILRLLLLSFMMASVAQAQTYIPFPTANTIWREQFCPNSWTPYAIHNYGLKNNDTLIQNVAYHKLYRSTDTIFDESELNGFIREDTQKRVYYRVKGATDGPQTDKLIYDFSLEPGDVLQGSENNGINNWMVPMQVTQVDSVQINGTYHRRILFDWPGSAWVEGVGNITRGLLFFSATWPNNGQWNDLICLGRQNDWIWHNTNSADGSSAPLPACNENLVGIKDHSLPAEAIVFSPQPVVATSTLYLNNGEKLGAADVYDLAGRKIKTYTADQDGRISVYRSDFLPGIYLYRLSTRKGIAASGRFVVQ